mgnify:CR=1 FL=1
MAEVKNSFLASKMNKDLDDRLIPNGEYRDARNISVGRSEDDDIGALENVLGNSKILGPGGIPLELDETLVCISYFMDNSNNIIYQFLTNYNGNEETFATSTHKITRLDFDNNQYTTLVEGTFLNFCTTNLILGINLIGNLLFWTDNRNQPRKINVELANPQNIISPNYYTTEQQISVAKYAPVDPILLYKKAVVTVVDQISPIIFEVNDINGVEVGMTVISNNAVSCDFITITEISGNNITLSGESSPGIKPTDILTLLISTMTNQSDDPTWPGDPDFLEDKYIRFSYRFRFNDGEYSLMAPFTQIAFIPKQKGYFLNGNEKEAYASTIVNWMENNVNNVELLINLPDKGSNINNSYKIIELDILYKESDSLAVKVLETIPVTSSVISELDTNIYTYQYQSQKPYKTLSEAQTIRVYDKVPITALAQDVSGNRIIYGNFRDQHTAPLSINYNVAVLPKQDIFTNFIEYPNHTLKQNRNYQVGFILADKYGRQSSVILSSNDVSTDSNSTYFGGSTVYSPYYNDTNSPNVKCWNGNALSVLINSTINSSLDMSAGTPGLYAEVINGGNGFIITSGIVNNVGPYTYNFDSTSDIENIPTVGTYLRGEYTDFVQVIPNDPDIIPPDVYPNYTITTNGEISTIYNLSINDPDIKYAYNINPLGWYSYKIVVRQQEQDYYNAYLPGMLNGYPIKQTYGSQVTYDAGVATLQNGINTTEFPTTEVNKTAHIVLLNDNINKIPRDLAEVGPDQKQYRSSVELYGRVENTVIRIPSNPLDTITALAVSTTTTFTYDTTTYPEVIEAIAGDSLICMDSGAIWYKNTTIVSNIIIGTTGTIKFTPANIAGYSDFIINQGSNKQYYPPKKSDLASTIANATDLKFLLNTVDNITGSAAINLYQLETNPIVARISTTNGIGVEAEDMLPYLSVYETKPISSLLDLFWETTSTGLIADLNADINTGFNGPSTLAKFDFIFYENQDPNGIGIGTGDADSPYITDTFSVLTPEGSTVVGITNATLAVVNLENTIVTSNFELVSSGGDYRIKITNNQPFIYGTNANIRSYLFYITFTYNGTDTTLSFNGSLSNIEPSFDLPCGDYDVTITQNDTNIVTFTGVNGSFTNSDSELHWEIYSGNEDGYFTINGNTGVLTKTVFPITSNPITANKVYNLGIRLWDAWNTTTGIGDLFATCTVTITTWPASVPLHFYQTLTTASPGSVDAFHGYVTEQAGGIYTGSAYGLFYVSPKVIEPFDSAGYPPPAFGDQSPSKNRIGAPSAPECGTNYQLCINMESLSTPTPSPASYTGLTAGALLWSIELTGASYTSPFGQWRCNGSSTSYTEGTASILIYARPLNSTSLDPNSWTLVTDYNNVQETSPGVSANTWDLANQNIKPTVKVSTNNSFYSTKPKLGKSTVSFITTSETPMQWAIAVKLTKKTNCGYDLDPGGYWNQWFKNEITAKVSCQDANYLRPGPTRPVQVFSTGLEDPITNYPSGVPFTTQDATVHDASFQQTVANNTISSTIIELVNNNGILITPGMVVSGPSIIGFTQVSQINVDDNPNKIEITTTQTLTSGDLLTFSVSFNTSKGTVYSPLVIGYGTNVRQFYTDITCLLPWTPPVPGKFYVFMNPFLDYQTGTGGSDFMPEVQDQPYFSARFNASGQVYESDTTAYTSQSGWEHDPIQSGEPLKTGRNIRQQNGNL